MGRGPEAVGFDAVVMVDWSSAAVPRLGADSIWLALARVGAGSLDRLENIPTRAAAIDAVEGIARAEAAAGRRVLIGFDFPFGYSAGTAAALTGHADWRAVWALLHERIEDGPDNANNRFEVAAALNRTVWDGEGPFWGRPPRPDRRGLPTRKPAGYGERYPPERRAVERRVPKAQPGWKLFTTGSVGGQVLVGLAALERLRRRLGDLAAVWPFETGWECGVRPATLAEIYPSLLAPDPREAVKDAGQVRAVAETLARLAARGRLAPLFGRPEALTEAEERAALAEEAWILGVGWETALRG
ncbi:MAG: cobalamin biosynthesis protein CbiG [Pseudomonadota bacterium]